MEVKSTKRVVSYIAGITAISVLLQSCGGGGGGGSTSAAAGPAVPSGGRVTGQLVYPSATPQSPLCVQLSGYSSAVASTVLVQDSTLTTLETFTTGKCGEFDHAVSPQAKYLTVSVSGYQTLTTPITVFSTQLSQTISLWPIGAVPEIVLVGYVWDTRAQTTVRQINISIVDSIQGKPIFGIDQNQINLSVAGVATPFTEFRDPTLNPSAASVGIALYDASPICSGNLDPVHGSYSESCDPAQSVSIANRLTIASDIAHALIDQKPNTDEWSFVGFNQTMRNLAAQSVKEIATGNPITLDDSPVGSGFMTDPAQLHLFPDIANAYSRLYQNGYPLSTITAPRSVASFFSNASWGYFNVFPGFKATAGSPYTTIGIASNLPGATGKNTRRAALAVLSGSSAPYPITGVTGLVSGMTRLGTPLIVLDLNDSDAEDQTLVSLANASGGFYRHVPLGSSSSDAVNAISNTLRYQYTVDPLIGFQESLNNRVPDLTVQLINSAGAVLASRKIKIQ